MFRIQKGYDTESKTFRLPVGMIRKLEEVAAKNNTSLNRVVIQCLNYALENLDESDHDTPKEEDQTGNFCPKPLTSGFFYVKERKRKNQKRLSFDKFCGKKYVMINAADLSEIYQKSRIISSNWQFSYIVLLKKTLQTV